MLIKVNLDNMDSLIKYKFNLTQVDLNIECIKPGKFCNCYAEFDDEIIKYKNNEFNEIADSVNKKHSFFKQFNFGRGNVNISISNDSNCTIIQNGVAINGEPTKTMAPLNLYLNKEQMYSLFIQNTTGEVFIKGMDNSKKLEIDTTSGNVILEDCDKLGKEGTIKINTASGNVGIDDCHHIELIDTMSGNIDIKNSSDINKIDTMAGDVYLSKCNLLKTNIDTQSGDVIIKGCNIENRLTIDTMSGDIELYNIPSQDCNKIITKTLTGDIYRKI